MHPLHGVWAEITSPHAGLVGYEDERQTEFLHPAKSLDGAGQKLYPVRIAQVMTFNDDRAVAV